MTKGQMKRKHVTCCSYSFHAKLSANSAGSITVECKLLITNPPTAAAPSIEAGLGEPPENHSFTETNNARFGERPYLGIGRSVAKWPKRVCEANFHLDQLVDTITSSSSSIVRLTWLQHDIVWVDDFL